MIFKRKSKKVVSLTADPGKCLGCGTCVRKCKHDVFVMKQTENGRYAIARYTDSCKGCGKCRKACPGEAIGLITE